MFEFCHCFREALWEKHRYESLSLPLEDSEEEDEEVDSLDLNYVIGDVTHPQETQKDAIVIHCAGREF
jgi:hypothetical protein